MASMFTMVLLMLLWVEPLRASYYAKVVFLLVVYHPLATYDLYALKISDCLFALLPFSSSDG